MYQFSEWCDPFVSVNELEPKQRISPRIHIHAYIIAIILTRS